MQTYLKKKKAQGCVCGPLLENVQVIRVYIKASYLAPLFPHLDFTFSFHCNFMPLSSSLSLQSHVFSGRRKRMIL